MKETEPAAPANASRISRLARLSKELGIGSLIALGIACILPKLVTLYDVRWVLYIIPFLLSLVAGLAAVVLARVAVYRIRSSPEPVSGRANAFTGFWTGATSIAVIVGLGYLFYTRPRYHVSRSSCYNNLRQLDGAKEQWALEYRKTTNDTPAMTDLIGYTNYIKVLPSCPANGTYILNRLGVKPRCTFSGHTLE
ncbi:MAG: hypothetical protein WCO56_10610 [Verrucomicrobiota bacterium]